VITASDDKTVRIWDVSTGDPITPPLEHQGIPTAAGFSPDGTRVVTASLDDKARVWDAWTGKPVTPPLTHHGFIIAMAFGPNGARVVTASEDQTAQVWNASTGEQVTSSLEDQDDVHAAAFSPDGTRVVTASRDKPRVWDASIPIPVTWLRKHRSDFSTIWFNTNDVSGDTESAEPVDMGTLEDWQVRVRCSPFVLVDNDHGIRIRANPDPLRRCPRH
jgi:WD40 repeat protein